MIRYQNARLYGRPETSFAVENGRFVLFDHEPAGVDLKGAFVYPGFNDSHMHLLSFGAALTQVPLQVNSLKALKQRLKDHYIPGQKLIGRGWNQDYFADEKRYPTRQELDEISRDDPVVITRACGHVLIANSKAIAMADIHEVPGGSFDLDSGLFKERATALIQNAVNQYSREDIKAMILRAQKELNRYGITSVQSDDLRSLPVSYQTILETFQDMKKELTVRVNEQAQLLNSDEISDILNQRGYDPFFKIGPLKILSDGSLGARTAYLSRDYHDAPGHNGTFTWDEEELRELMRYAHVNGMSIAVHAIGDGALDIILDIFADILKKYPRSDHRHGIIHCQIMRQEQLERMKKMNLTAYIQPVFLDYDNHIVKERVGEELASSSYPFHTLYQYNHAAGGSDCPVELPDVLKGIKLAMTRTSLDGCGPYRPEEALSLDEAIHLYTKNGAYLSFEENQKGQLKAGQYADFVILDKERILATFVDGRCVYHQ